MDSISEQIKIVIVEIKDAVPKIEQLRKISHLFTYQQKLVISKSVDFKRVDLDAFIYNVNTFLGSVVRYFESDSFPLNKSFKTFLNNIVSFFEIEELAVELMPVMTQFMELILDPSVEFWICYQLVDSFESILTKLNDEIKQEFFTHHKINLYKLMDTLCTCGDYGFQTKILRSIFELLPNKQCDRELSYHFFPDDKALEEDLHQIEQDTFDADCRHFLNRVNSKTLTVISIKAKSVYGDSVNILPPNFCKDDEEVWVDFNFKSESVSIQCSVSSFTEHILAADLDDTIFINKSVIRNINVKSMKRQQIIIINLSDKMTLEADYAESFKMKCRVVNIVLDKNLQQKDLVDNYLPRIFGSLFLGNTNPSEMEKVRNMSTTPIYPTLPVHLRSVAASNRTSVSAKSFPRGFYICQDDEAISEDSSGDVQGIPLGNLVLCAEQNQEESQRSMLVQHSNQNMASSKTSAQRMDLSMNALPPTQNELELLSMEAKSLEILNMRSQQSEQLESLNTTGIEKGLVKVTVPKRYYKKISNTLCALESISEDEEYMEVDDEQILIGNVLLAQHEDNIIFDSNSDASDDSDRLNNKTVSNIMNKNTANKATNQKPNNFDSLILPNEQENADTYKSAETDKFYSANVENSSTQYDTAKSKISNSRIDSHELVILKASQNESESQKIDSSRSENVQSQKLQLLSASSSQYDTAKSKMTQSMVKSRMLVSESQKFDSSSSLKTKSSRGENVQSQKLQILNASMSQPENIQMLIAPSQEVNSQSDKFQKRKSSSSLDVNSQSEQSVMNKPSSSQDINSQTDKLRMLEVSFSQDVQSKSSKKGYNKKKSPQKTDTVASNNMETQYDSFDENVSYVKKSAMKVPAVATEDSSDGTFILKQGDSQKAFFESELNLPKAASKISQNSKDAGDSEFTKPKDAREVESLELSKSKNNAKDTSASGLQKDANAELSNLDINKSKAKSIELSEIESLHLKISEFEETGSKLEDNMSEYQHLFSRIETQKPLLPDTEQSVDFAAETNKELVSTESNAFDKLVSSQSERVVDSACFNSSSLDSFGQFAKRLQSQPQNTGTLKLKSRCRKAPLDSFSGLMETPSFSGLIDKTCGLIDKASSSGMNQDEREENIKSASLDSFDNFVKDLQNKPQEVETNEFPEMVTSDDVADEIDLNDLSQLTNEMKLRERIDHDLYQSTPCSSHNQAKPIEEDLILDYSTQCSSVVKRRGRSKVIHESSDDSDGGLVIDEEIESSSFVIGEEAKHKKEKAFVKPKSRWINSESPIIDDDSVFVKPKNRRINSEETQSPTIDESVFVKPKNRRINSEEMQSPIIDDDSVFVKPKNRRIKQVVASVVDDLFRAKDKVMYEREEVILRKSCEDLPTDKRKKTTDKKKIKQDVAVEEEKHEEIIKVKKDKKARVQDEHESVQVNEIEEMSVSKANSSRKLKAPEKTNLNEDDKSSRKLKAQQRKKLNEDEDESKMDIDESKLLYADDNKMVVDDLNEDINECKEDADKKKPLRGKKKKTKSSVLNEDDNKMVVDEANEEIGESNEDDKKHLQAKNKKIKSSMLPESNHKMVVDDFNEDNGECIEDTNEEKHLRAKKKKTKSSVLNEDDNKMVVDDFSECIEGTNAKKHLRAKKKKTKPSVLNEDDNKMAVYDFSEDNGECIEDTNEKKHLRAKKKKTKSSVLNEDDNKMVVDDFSECIESTNEKKHLRTKKKKNKSSELNEDGNRMVVDEPNEEIGQSNKDAIGEKPLRAKYKKIKSSVLNEDDNKIDDESTNEKMHLRAKKNKNKSSLVNEDDNKMVVDEANEEIGESNEDASEKKQLLAKNKKIKSSVLNEDDNKIDDEGTNEKKHLRAKKNKNKSSMVNEDDNKMVVDETNEEIGESNEDASEKKQLLAKNKKIKSSVLQESNNKMVLGEDADAKVDHKKNFNDYEDSNNNENEPFRAKKKENKPSVKHDDDETKDKRKQTIFKVFEDEKKPYVKLTDIIKQKKGKKKALHDSTNIFKDSSDVTDKKQKIRKGKKALDKENDSIVEIEEHFVQSLPKIKPAKIVPELKPASERPSLIGSLENAVEDFSSMVNQRKNLTGEDSARLTQNRFAPEDFSSMVDKRLMSRTAILEKENPDEKNLAGNRLQIAPEDFSNKVDKRLLSRTTFVEKENPNEENLAGNRLQIAPDDFSNKVDKRILSRTTLVEKENPDEDSTHAHLTKTRLNVDESEDCSPVLDLTHARSTKNRLNVDESEDCSPLFDSTHAHLTKNRLNVDESEDFSPLFDSTHAHLTKNNLTVDESVDYSPVLDLNTPENVTLEDKWRNMCKQIEKPKNPEPIKKLAKIVQPPLEDFNLETLQEDEVIQDLIANRKKIIIDDSHVEKPNSVESSEPTKKPRKRVTVKKTKTAEVNKPVHSFQLPSFDDFYKKRTIEEQITEELITTCRNNELFLQKEEELKREKERERMEIQAKQRQTIQKESTNFDEIIRIDDDSRDGSTKNINKTRIEHGIGLNININNDAIYTSEHSNSSVDKRLKPRQISNRDTILKKNFDDAIFNKNTQPLSQLESININQDESSTANDKNANEIRIDDDLSIIDPSIKGSEATFKVPLLRCSQSEVNLREIKKSRMRKLYNPNDLSHLSPLEVEVPKPAREEPPKATTSKRKRVYLHNESFNSKRGCNEKRSRFEDSEYEDEMNTSNVLSEGSTRRFEEIFKGICDKIRKPRKNSKGSPFAVPRKRTMKKIQTGAKRVLKYGNTTRHSEVNDSGSKVQVLQDVRLGDAVVVNDEFGDILRQIGAEKEKMNKLYDKFHKMVVDFKTRASKSLTKLDLNKIV